MQLSGVILTFYEKSSIERYLMEEMGHTVYKVPKFHCELNPSSECGLSQNDIRRPIV